MLITLIRLAVAGLLIILPAQTITGLAVLPFLLYVAFILTVIFGSSLMRTRKERGY
ncbi:hypothetical protein ACFQ1S_19055 [Kibdelosporangium lantanae]|uniref:Uncharacterized protein n=1 Tax=Kibdelosporangium lantanae TaxID=1497396 RepID=A0ABW3MD08_9PSEU